MTKEHEAHVAMTSGTEGKLISMANAAAKSASEALAKLSQRRVTISVASVEIKPVQRVFPGILPETVVAGVYLPATGDIKGASLLVFTEDAAFLVCDMLLMKEEGTTRKLTEVDISALTEAGRILCGSFLTVLSNTMRIKIVEHVPSFSLDMFGAVVDVLIAEMVQIPTEALVIQMRFAFDHARVAGPILFILGIQDLETVLKAVDTIKRGA